MTNDRTTPGINFLKVNKRRAFFLSLLLAGTADVQVACAGLEEAPPALLRLGRRLLVQRAQISQVRQAEGAGHRAQVKFDVLLLGRLQHLEEIAAQLFAAGAAQA